MQPRSQGGKVALHFRHFALFGFDALLITMGCGDKCPTFRAFAGVTCRCPIQKAVPWLRFVQCATISRFVLQNSFRLKDQRDNSPSYIGAVSCGAISLNRGALLAAGKPALKSNAVCSWPSGCCSRHNSSRSGGICERTAFVRPTFAWQPGQSEIIRWSKDFPGTR
jgi:hypothetical protein